MRSALAILFLLGMGAGPVLAQPPATAVADHPPRSFPFVTVTDDDGTTRTYRTNIIPLWPNKVSFGWQMDLGGGERTIQLTEILSLSAPSQAWKVGDGTTIEDDGRRAVSRLPAYTQSGLLSRRWEIVLGDPPGKYRFDVWIDGTYRGQFTYCAIEVPDTPEVRVDELACPNAGSVHAPAAPGPTAAAAAHFGDFAVLAYNWPIPFTSFAR